MTEADVPAANTRRPSHRPATEPAARYARAVSEPHRSGRLSHDTDRDVELALIAAWRVMSSTEKAAQLSAGFHALAALSEAGVRLRHPEASALEVNMRVATLRLGSNLVKDVYGWEPAAGA